MPSRPQVVPAEDWHQIELLALAPGQRIYERIHLPLYTPQQQPRTPGAAQALLFPLEIEHQ